MSYEGRTTKEIRLGYLTIFNPIEILLVLYLFPNICFGYIQGWQIGQIAQP
jgi:hypothetical protein